MDEFGYHAHCPYYDTTIVTRYAKDCNTRYMEMHFILNLSTVTSP